MAALALPLVGCGDWRRRAEENESRLTTAEETARIAERASAQNAARLLRLEERVDALEDARADVAEPGADDAP
jgi:hypothetical protein